ncbi:hypothetical protein BGX30_011841 [Mortierella sp. GBA39]|nr:hypothetical protein BGX30_011841 [Mortierella sp. GBA39]
MPTMMLTTSADNIPPEVLERIALFLDPHSLTACIRVCRFWLDCFLPSLYHTIHVYHFDYFSTNQDSGYPRRSDGIVRTSETVGYGGQFVHKHGQFIKDVTVGTTHALKYLLRPECVNLVRVTTVVPDRNVKFRAMPKRIEELKSWQDRFGRDYDESLVSQVWEPLFVQNPGLCRVSINSLPGRGKIMVRMCKALGGLAQLEELHIKYVLDRNVMEALMDSCPQVSTLTVKIFVTKSTNPRQDFRSLENYAQITNEPRTQVKKLNLFSSGRMGIQPWIIPILWRCPLLERLVIPFTVGELYFGPIMRTIVEHCPMIRYLKVRIQERFTSADTITALDDLLNTGCPRLTSLHLYDAADIFLMERHFRNPDLKERLEEFCCSAGSKRLLERRILGAEVGFGVLMVCPNLRVFVAPLMMLDVDEFLEMEFACLERLETLHLRLRCPPRIHLVAAAAPAVAAVAVVEGDDEKDRVKEGEGEGTTIQSNKTEKVAFARLYYQSIQDKVVDKLAQFRSLKELLLRKDHSKNGAGDRLVDFHLDMREGEGEGEGKVKVFAARMPMLRKLCIDGVSYSKEMEACRRRC